MKFLEELKWRGMIHDIIPGTEEQLEKEMTTGYIGFDPTSDSLHIGSLVPILLLVHLQNAGHKPIALLGGATGMVGDPSGKSEERNLLDESTLKSNLLGVKTQLEKFLDFDPAHPNGAEMANNFDWFKEMNFLQFIRDVGKHITVNYMMSKDSVKKRLESENGMSFTEFSYQLIQGYDFYWLNTNRNCKLQMGGSDQWGNILTGTEIIRRRGGGEAFAFTCPLIRKSDGGKFGKTEKGNIWLDPKKTSPYQFYQFWLNASDEDALSWIKIFTLMDVDKIEILIQEHLQAPHLRILQKQLAREVTVFVHGEKEFEFALKTSEILFGNATSKTIQELTEEQLLLVFEGVPASNESIEIIRKGIDIITFLASSGIFPSKGEARKTLVGGGVRINSEKIDNVNLILNESYLLNERYVIIQKGKKNYFLVRFN